MTIPEIIIHKEDSLVEFSDGTNLILVSFERLKEVMKDVYG